MCVCVCGDDVSSGYEGPCVGKVEKGKAKGGHGKDDTSMVPLHHPLPPLAKFSRCTLTAFFWLSPSLASCLALPAGQAKGGLWGKAGGAYNTSDSSIAIAAKSPRQLE